MYNNIEKYINYCICRTFWCITMDIIKEKANRVNVTNKHTGHEFIYKDVHDALKEILEKIGELNYRITNLEKKYESSNLGNNDIKVLHLIDCTCNIDYDNFPQEYKPLFIHKMIMKYI